jgi:hypothetical protein
MDDMNKSQASKYIAIIVVSFAIGAAAAAASFWIGQQSGLKKTAGQTNQSNTVANPSAPVTDNSSSVTENKNSVDVISGKIKSIDNNVISLENIGFVSTAAPIAGLDKEIRKVTVDDQTKFSTNASGNAIKLADLKVGDEVFVFATTDISTKQEFTAALVTLQVPIDPASLKDVPAPIGTPAQ